MLSIRPAEYISRFDSDNIPASDSSWTLTSPNATVWAATVSIAGIVSLTDGAVAAASIIFIGLDGLKWTSTISNGGIVTATQGAVISSSDLVGVLVDGDGVTWVLYVDDDGQAKITTATILPTLLRYPAFRFSYTPSAAADMCLLHSVRLNISERRAT